MGCSSCGSGSAPKNNYSPKKVTNWGGMKTPSAGMKSSGAGFSRTSASGFGKPSVRMSFGGKKK